MKEILLYVDPGSGSYLIQAIIAAVLGAGFALKTWWWRIKAFFGKKTQEDQSQNSEVKSKK